MGQRSFKTPVRVRRQRIPGATSYLAVPAILVFVLIWAVGAAAQLLPVKLADAQGLTDTTGGYRLNPGDVLEITVQGFPELKQRAMIELNGEAALPPAGRIRLVDMTIAEAQSAIRMLVTAKPLRQRSGDGRDTLTVVAADDVNISVVEYRPVYIMGDVAKPGELRFRPGLTVRQAIALAGGFDVMRYRLVNPFLESADMKGRQESLWTEIAKTRIEIARIRAELDENSTLDPSALKDIPLDPRFIEQIFNTESETLTRRLDNASGEREHLKTLIRLAGQRISTINATIGNEQQGLDDDKKGYADLLQFSARGSVPLLRLMEIKRNQVTSSSRVLQARLQLEQSQRDEVEVARALRRLENERRTDLLKELQAASVKYNELEAQLSANSEKLRHTSLLKSRLVRGPDAKAAIRVFRTDRNERQQIEAQEDSVLQPADTVEIALQTNEADIGAGGPSSNLVPNAKRADTESGR